VSLSQKRDDLDTEEEQKKGSGGVSSQFKTVDLEGFQGTDSEQETHEPSSSRKRDDVPLRSDERTTKRARG
jgi:hypothetical protein